MSEDARRMLRELLAEALSGSGHGNGHAAPQVPAPPVAAVLRPSTWSQPPAPGEVIGDAHAPAGAAAENAGVAGGADARVAGGADARIAGGGHARGERDGGARVEVVALRSDADLARFVAHVLANAAAIRGGALRFTFGEAASGVRRIEKGAVTERTVNEAAQAGQRLVLAPAAVLTPLAKERARHLKVEIERERRC
jgi:hypothetical protein